MSSLWSPWFSSGSPAFPAQGRATGAGCLIHPKAANTLCLPRLCVSQEPRPVGMHCATHCGTENALQTELEIASALRTELFWELLRCATQWQTQYKCKSEIVIVHHSCRFGDSSGSPLRSPGSTLASLCCFSTPACLDVNTGACGPRRLAW